jgi:hypothetical protein
LANQETHEPADQLADLDEDEQHQNRKESAPGVVPEVQARYAVEVAHFVLPAVEIEDHQDLADDPDAHERQPGPPRGRWTGVL